MPSGRHGDGVVHRLDVAGPAQDPEPWASLVHVDRPRGAPPIRPVPGPRRRLAEGGEHAVEGRTDGGGRIARVRFAVVVADTVAPALHDVPADITVEATGPSGARVDYTPPTATDVVDPHPDVNCARATGRRFDVGTTTVTCTARDRSGNRTSASFHVTVIAPAR